MHGAPFHAGECALQAQAGQRERLAGIGAAVIRDHMPAPHRELFERLPTLLLALQDDAGQPWATMLQGPPGFITSPDERSLHIATLPAAADPVAPWLRAGAAVGLLGLEPHTRRRNRANGRVRGIADGGFGVQVLQSFGNCPKYIHARRPEAIAPHAAVPAVRLGPGLDPAALALLRRADTLFIASAAGPRAGASAAEGVDVSHRGGPAGFVRVTQGPAGWRLTLPDYAGNFFFNTLGNLQLWPQAGLLVPDLDDGSLLHLAAEARLQTEGPALADFAGAQRLLHLDLRAGWWRPQALPLRWTTPD